MWQAKYGLMTTVALLLLLLLRHLLPLRLLLFHRRVQLPLCVVCQGARKVKTRAAVLRGSMTTLVLLLLLILLPLLLLVFHRRVQLPLHEGARKVKTRAAVRASTSDPYHH